MTRAEVTHCFTDGSGRLGVRVRMKVSIQVAVPFMEMEKAGTVYREAGHVQELWV